MKIYAAKKLTVDKESLKKSIFYLFNYVSDQLNLEPGQLKIKKMELYRGQGSKVYYILDVYYKINDIFDKLSIRYVPMNQEIPEKFWIGYKEWSLDKPLGQKFLHTIEKEIKIDLDKFNNAFEEFKQVVNADSKQVIYSFSDSYKYFSDILGRYSEDTTTSFSAELIGIKNPNFKFKKIDWYDYQLTEIDSGKSIKVHIDLEPIYIYYNVISGEFFDSYDNKIIDNISEYLADKINKNDSKIREELNKFRYQKMYYRKVSEIDEYISSQLIDGAEFIIVSDIERMPDLLYDATHDGSSLCKSDYGKIEDILTADKEELDKVVNRINTWVKGRITRGQNKNKQEEDRVIYEDLED